MAGTSRRTCYRGVGVTMVMILASGCASAPVSSTEPSAPKARTVPACPPAKVHVAPSPSVGWVSEHVSPGIGELGSGFRSCFADDGCPYVPRQLPECAEGTLVDIGWWDDAQLGDRMTVRGILEPIYEYEPSSSCDDHSPCCKVEHQQLVVRTSRGRIGLRSTTNAFAFRCFGDQTGQCCPFAPLGVEVLVRGAKAAPFRFNNYEFTDPELCRVPTP